MLNGRRLPLTIAFAGLLLVAFGAGCQGFFVRATLTSVTVNPTAPAVAVGQQSTLTAYGTYSDNSRNIITSGVTWSSATPTVATIGTNTGILVGVSPGSSTITASAQGISATAAATVLLANVTSLTVTPTSQNAIIGGSAVQFTFTAISGGTSIPLTSDNGGFLTVTPNDTFVTCTATAPSESCSATTGAAGTYQIKMTYPGSTASATATLTVS